MSVTLTPGAATLRDLEALRKNGRPRFLVVAGASGTGKSSMVLAGATTMNLTP